MPEIPDHDDFWANPFIVDVAQDLGLLEEIHNRSPGEVIRACEAFLQAAPVLARLDDMEPGRLLAVDAESLDPNGTMETWFFFKLPYAPDPATGESEWMTTSHDWRQPSLSHSVHMRGAFMPVPGSNNGPITVEDRTIRHNVGLLFYETAIFRSSDDAPPGLLTTPLPTPEDLIRTEPGYFEMNRQIGQIVIIDDTYYWRMPTAFQGTGRVMNVRVEPLAYTR